MDPASGDLHDEQQIERERRRLVQQIAEALAQGDRSEAVLQLLHLLAADAKWEVRSDVAVLLPLLPDREFVRLAAMLSEDPNMFVGKATERALDRRRRGQEYAERVVHGLDRGGVPMGKPGAGPRQACGRHHLLPRRLQLQPVSVCSAPAHPALKAIRSRTAGLRLWLFCHCRHKLLRRLYLRQFTASIEFGMLVSSSMLDSIKAVKLRAVICALSPSASGAEGYRFEPCRGY